MPQITAYGSEDIQGSAPMHDNGKSTSVDIKDGSEMTPLERTELSLAHYHHHRKKIYVIFSSDSEHWTISILIPLLVELNVEVDTMLDAIPGKPIISMMEDFINKADGIITVISKQSIVDKYFLHNIHCALQKDLSILIIPVLYENATYKDIPEQISHVLPIYNNDPEFKKKMTRSVRYIAAYRSS